MSDPADPYRAPQSAPQSAPAILAESDGVDPATLVNAGKGRRFLTFLVDYVGQVVLMFLLMIPLVFVLSEQSLARIENMSKLEEVLVGLPLLIAYYALFEGLFGRTPGKWICGTRVIDENSGRKPGWGQVLGRTFARLVPFEAFSLLFSEENRGWHDSWPRTRVVRTR